MSLAINTQKVTAVLLSDGNWYDVEPGSFDLDAYEFFAGDFYENMDYSVTPPLWKDVPCSTGFLFKNSGTLMMGPATAIQAVRY